MLLPKGTNPEKFSEDTLDEFIQKVFSVDPWSKNIGQKGIKVINLSQNEPDALYIRLHKLGGRVPYTMGLDENTKFQEHELIFLLDIRVPITEQQTPDNKPTPVHIRNFETKKSYRLGTSGEIINNVCNALRTVMELYDWRMELSRMGIHNPTLQDERESYQGTEYMNPMRLTFNSYVLI
jgi:hypothetical protein